MEFLTIYCEVDRLVCKHSLGNEPTPNSAYTAATTIRKHTIQAEAKKSPESVLLGGSGGEIYAQRCSQVKKIQEVR